MNYIQLGDVIAAAKVERCGENDFPVLSITKSDGLVLQSEKFKKRIASKDTTDYKVVHRGQLVQGIHIDEANFGIQEVVDVGIVSPAYKIWDLKSDRIIPKYLETVLRSPQSIAYYTSKFNGSVKRRERLTDKDFLQMNIPCPSINDQIYVIEVLNRTTELVNQRKNQLQKLDELIKARFVEMFGDQKTNPYRWKQTTIGDSCTLKSGSSLPTDRENEGGTIPYVKVGDMNYPGNEQYITTSSRFVTEQTAGTGIFPVGTVIFPKRGGAIGTNKKRITALPICADLNVMGVTAGNELTPQYLMAYFTMIDLGTLDNGSSVPQINNKDIAPLVICLPPLERQNEFAAFVEQTDKSKVAVQKALDEAQLLFDSLMQKYFG